MGCVYKATHTLIERKVAIKTLREHAASSAAALERFKREAKANTAIVHPNLVTMYDFGLVDDKHPYIVMEYIEGESLSQFLIREGALPHDELAIIFAQVCDGLSAMHEQGIVHRDLKPSNIMLCKKSDGKFNVKLVDFGIAKILSPSAPTLTCAGDAIGTPAYMSPEQCRAQAVCPRADLYSLGCTMFYAFTGSPPFRGATALEMFMMHVSNFPSAELLEESDVAPQLIELVLALMAKSPEDRPACAQTVKKTLLSLA
jgi:serine/threonine-protein kinase